MRDRNADREFDAPVAARDRFDVDAVLLRREQIREQRAELHLAPRAAALHVGQDALQIADTLGQRLHLAQAPVHLIQPIGHELERLAEARFERLLQLLVDGGAHLVELFRVLVAQRVESLLERRADRLEALLGRLRQLREALCERAKLLALRTRCRSELLVRRSGELVESLADLAAQRFRRFGLIAPQRREVQLHVPLEVLALGLEHGEVGCERARLLRGRHERTQATERNGHQHDEDHEQCGAGRCGPQEVFRHRQSLHARAIAPRWDQGRGPPPRAHRLSRRRTADRSGGLAPRIGDACIRRRIPRIVDVVVRCIAMDSSDITLDSVRPAAVAGLFYPGASAGIGPRRGQCARAGSPREPGAAEGADRPACRLHLFGSGRGGCIRLPALVVGDDQACRDPGPLPSRPAHRPCVADRARFRDAARARAAGSTRRSRRSRRCPRSSYSDAAHAREHALEVQLPFLQRVLGSFCDRSARRRRRNAEEVAEVIDRLWGGPETLIVISSDLSHYHGYDEARRRDAATAQAILRFDAGIDHEQACGATPIAGMLTVAKRRALVPKLLGLCNSGDTAGDRQRVVGYAAFAFHESDDGDDASDETQGHTLLKLARGAIHEALGGPALPADRCTLARRAGRLLRHAPAGPALARLRGLAQGPQALRDDVIVRMRARRHCPIRASAPLSEDELAEHARRSLGARAAGPSVVRGSQRVARAIVARHRRSDHHVGAHARDVPAAGLGGAAGRWRVRRRADPQDRAARRHAIARLPVRALSRAQVGRAGAHMRHPVSTPGCVEGAARRGGGRDRRVQRSVHMRHSTRVQARARMRMA